MNGVTILTIGDELLIGQTVDTNSAWMGQELNKIGLEIVEIISVADSKEGIINGLERASDQSDVVLMTGGLGPTKDDITKKVLSEYFETALSFHQETWDRVVKIFERYDRKPLEEHRLQCFMPESASILPNKMGTAPAMLFKKGSQSFVSMPGVPHEMKTLMKDHILDHLKEKYTKDSIIHRTLMTVGEGETRLNQKFLDIEENLPDNLSIAFLPALGSVRIRITGKGSNKEKLEQQLISTATSIEERIKPYHYGYDGETLAHVIGKLCLERKLKIGFAESCTGGMLSNKITVTPGCSSYFNGSIIAYSNEIKEKTLGVNPSTLNEYGAVSEETVKEMVMGAIDELQVNLAVAVSGIAGPGGGTKKKPVGTIWIACGDKNKIVTKKLSLGKDRLINMEYSTVRALALLRWFILDL